MTENLVSQDKPVSPDSSEQKENPDPPSNKPYFISPNSSLLFLAFASLGVVYGDIGTSPLYAIKECFSGPHAIEITRMNILGVLSLVFWSLTMVIGFKYIGTVMKANNHGEGGIFALLALIPADKKINSSQKHSIVVLAALLGASLLYGDGVITPVISVLSAIEGLEVATQAAKNFIVPLTCLVLFGLFYMQSRGTSSIGKIFGPIVFVWFLTISLLGIIQIFKVPDILVAINPIYAIKFFIVNKIHGFVVLGSVVLVITGGEALYADMGHFGRKPLQLSWFAFVFPALLLNYFGQGALLLHTPTMESASNPFYQIVPRTFIYPMVILSTLATVIASQAMISGAFSLTRQAVQLGFLPRINIIHTSASTEGQIYIPFANKLMMIACIFTVLFFKESGRLASAYGMAVTANMVLTSIVFSLVIIYVWKWSLKKAILLVGFFMFFDIAYFGSNVIKFWDGGWFPTVIAITIFIIMTTWKDGRVELAKRIRTTRLPLYILPDGTTSLKQIPGTTHLFEPSQNISNWLPIELLTGEMVSYLDRVPGTAVFMSVSLKSIPPVLMHHLRHIKVLHEQVILLSIKSLDVPSVVIEDTVEVTELGFGFFQIVAFYGFMQTPNVPEIIKEAEKLGLVCDPENITYFLGRETLVISKGGMMPWRKTLFSFMSRNALSATAFFNLPPDRVVEMGMQIRL